jgi:hypothetical protein
MLCGSSLPSTTTWKQNQSQEVLSLAALTIAVQQALA